MEYVIVLDSNHNPKPESPLVLGDVLPFLLADQDLFGSVRLCITPPQFRNYTAGLRCLGDSRTLGVGMSGAPAGDSRLWSHPTCAPGAWGLPEPPPPPGGVLPGSAGLRSQRPCLLLGFLESAARARGLGPTLRLSVRSPSWRRLAGGSSLVLPRGGLSSDAFTCPHSGPPHSPLCLASCSLHGSGVSLGPQGRDGAWRWSPGRSV